MYAPPPRHRTHVAPSASAASAAPPFAGPDSDRRAALHGRVNVNGAAEGRAEAQKVVLRCVPDLLQAFEPVDADQRESRSSLPSNDDPAFYSAQAIPRNATALNGAGRSAANSSLTNRGSKLASSADEHARLGRLGTWTSGDVFNRSTLDGPGTDDEAASLKGQKRSRGPAGTGAKRRRGLAPNEFSLSSSEDELSAADDDEAAPYVPFIHPLTSTHDARPSQPVLPPTPLDPPSLLASPTLSHLFSKRNRTFEQIAMSASAMIESDLDVVRAVKEVGEVLRGCAGAGKGGARWMEAALAALDASEATKEKPAPDAPPDAPAVEPTSNTVVEPDLVKAEAPEMDIDSTAPAEAVAVGDHSPPEVEAMTRSGSPSQSSRTGTVDDSPYQGFSGPRRSSRRVPRGGATTIGDEDDRRSFPNGGPTSAADDLDPRLKLLADPTPWLTSLFVDPSGADVRLPVHQYAAVAAHSGTELGPDGLPLDPDAHMETLTPDQQKASLATCAFEVARFLADLEDYGGRLAEVRDGCLGVERRRKGVWSLVKIAAVGYEETSTGKAALYGPGGYPLGGAGYAGVSEGPSRGIGAGAGSGVYDGFQYADAGLVGAGGALMGNTTGPTARASGRGRGRGRGRGAARRQEDASAAE